MAALEGAPREQGKYWGGPSIWGLEREYRGSRRGEYIFEKGRSTLFPFRMVRLPLGYIYQRDTRRAEAQKVPT